MKQPPTILFDANVLYPAALRDIFIRLALEGVYHARWTEKILDEVFDNLANNRPDLDTRRLLRTRTLMVRSVPRCLVTDYEAIVGDFKLPDPDDRHVLAAAVTAGASTVVTNNVRDFPAQVTEPLKMTVRTANQFLADLARQEPAIVTRVVTEAAADLRHPSVTFAQYLDALAKAGAPTYWAELSCSGRQPARRSACAPHPYPAPQPGP